MEWQIAHHDLPFHTSVLQKEWEKRKKEKEKDKDKEKKKRRFEYNHIKKLVNCIEPLE